MSFARVTSGKGYTFKHGHKRQEEIYVVLKGSGIIYLDKKLLELSNGHITLTNPQV
tara:strand:- start:417 stop:584 length:168 start_codon:yes stop_codon:yes gene_type:complete